MEIHIKLAGLLQLLLGIMHVGFPSYFKWKHDLSSISLINRQMLYVHTFFLALVLLLMGISGLCWPRLFLSIETGSILSGGYAIFWLLRLGFQFFVYKRALWKGKTIETAIHVFFSFLWLYFTVVYTCVAMGLR